MCTGGSVRSEHVAESMVFFFKRYRCGIGNFAVWFEGDSVALVGHRMETYFLTPSGRRNSSKRSGAFIVDEGKAQKFVIAKRTKICGW